jgi:hypothetical protein
LLLAQGLHYIAQDLDRMSGIGVFHAANHLPVSKHEQEMVEIVVEFVGYRVGSAFSFNRDSIILRRHAQHRHVESARQDFIDDRFGAADHLLPGHRAVAGEAHYPPFAILRDDCAHRVAVAD